MNGPGDFPLTHSSTPDTKSCSLISIIPTLGMSSCRGRAEAFARSLSSKLRTLGPQTEDDVISPEDEPIINGDTNNTNSTWRTSNDSEQTVTDLQPLRHESDSFFDFDCELESPGSPVDECEYLRLIETASNTPHNSAAESGYVCASAASSQGSTEVPYFGHINDEDTVDAQQPQRTSLHPSEFPDYVKSLKSNGIAEHLHNGYEEEHINNTHEDDEESKDDATQTLEVEEDSNENVTEEMPRQPSPPLDEVALHEHLEHPEQCEHHPLPHYLQRRASKENALNALNTTELATIQHNIIAELQDHSDRVSEETDSQQKAAENDATDAKLATPPDIVTSPTTDEATQVELNISNGHTAEGEETLRIEMTEVPQGKEEKEVQTKELDQPLTVDISANISPTKGQKSHSGLDTTDDEDECRPQRIRRCSSLKTGKTPPGTPGRKKIVRFADVLGLDLADVKTFLDEIPNIPKSAYEDLEILESEPPIQLGPKSDRLLMPLFQQPGGLPSFLDLVREKQVSLENAAVTDHINQTITGTVRVRNLDFHKSVHIRYSLDNWRSFADLQANYVENSCDGFSDKFTFVLFGNTMQIGQRLEFAVRFQCKGQQFWDSNYGTNYCFQCLPATAPAVINPITAPRLPSHHNSHLTGIVSPTVSDAWCSSFY